MKNDKVNTFISKAKISPMKAKILPTLELLCVYTAISSLSLILDCYSNVKINNIFVAVDIQVFLSWLLTDLCNIKTKNVFSMNRIKDISLLKSELLKKYSITLKFKYAKTSDNPADLLSRGFCINKFRDQFELWVGGPQWLNLNFLRVS